MDNPAKQPLMKNVPPVPVDHLVGHLIQPGTTSKALRANKPRRCWSWLDHTWLMIFRSLQDSELWPSYSGRVTLPDDGVEFLSGETMIHPRHLPRTGVLKPVEELRMEGTEVSVAIDPIEGRKENGGKRKVRQGFRRVGKVEGQNRLQGWCGLREQNPEVSLEPDLHSK
jgi:hypothetical protein